jgi:hypothetical protein
MVIGNSEAAQRQSGNHYRETDVRQVSAPDQRSSMLGKILSRVPTARRASRSTGPGQQG